ARRRCSLRPLNSLRLLDSLRALSSLRAPELARRPGRLSAVRDAHFEPGGLAPGQQVDTPAVGESVDEEEAAAAGVQVLDRHETGQPAGRVADLDTDQAAPPAHTEAEDTGSGVAYGVADQFGDEQNGVLGDLGVEAPVAQDDDLDESAGGGRGLGAGR